MVFGSPERPERWQMLPELRPKAARLGAGSGHGLIGSLAPEPEKEKFL